ncbi:uncharacterized protein [Emydura macquarii macquarii]|uniref:uncharacterized protein n=1 Tax=Emydura macquarii macquarii TaxID=1129001 RepID=UPI00352B00C2
MAESEAGLFPVLTSVRAPPSPAAGAAAGTTGDGGASSGPVRSASQGARAGTAERDAKGARAGPGSCGAELPAPPGSESARSTGPRLGAEPASGAGPGLGAGRPAAQRGGVALNPADGRGPALMAWFASFMRKAPGLPGGDTPMPQCGAHSDAGAARTAQEIRSTAERLETQLQVLKGSSDPLTLEFLQALEAPIRIASRLLAENQRLRREVEELKGRLAAPPPREQASPPPAPWESSSWATGSTALLLQVRVSGRTAGCERQFLDQVAQRLAGQGLSLQAEEYEPHSGRPLLLFCPIASRAGTDISNALEGLPAARKAILVVLHHQLNERAELYANSRRQVRHPGLLGTVDGCFSTHSGFYPCQANATAVASVATLLQELARASP